MIKLSHFLMHKFDALVDRRVACASAASALTFYSQINPLFAQVTYDIRPYVEQKRKHSLPISRPDISLLMMLLLLLPKPNAKARPTVLEKLNELKLGARYRHQRSGVAVSTASDDGDGSLTFEMARGPRKLVFGMLRPTLKLRRLRRLSRFVVLQSAFAGQLASIGATALGVFVRHNHIVRRSYQLNNDVLAHVVLPDGRTMSEWAEPALRIAFERGQMPNNPLMLPTPKPGGSDER